MGFILGGALMLSEKVEGTIRALRISPMGVDRYLISKTLFFQSSHPVRLADSLLLRRLRLFRSPLILLSFFGAAVF